MNYFTWTKGKNRQIGKYFNTSEFECKCTYTDCIDQKISEELITQLDAVRDALKDYLIITSGFMRLS